MSIDLTEIRSALAGDLSMCLHRLKGRPLIFWRAVLAAEMARKRPRKRLTACLARRIQDLETWDARVAQINRALAAADPPGHDCPMAWQEAKEKAQQIYDELLGKHDHGFIGMVLEALQRLHTRAKPKRPPGDRPPETGDRR